MSLHFIIDGYNLIKQTPVLNKDSLEDSRVALIRFLSLQRPQGSSNNQVTVVFDGREGIVYWTVTPPSIEVIFTQNQSADDKIRRLVEESANPKNIVVVTNDREIQFLVRQLRAQVKRVDEFLEKFNPSTMLRIDTQAKSKGQCLQNLKQKADKKNSVDEKRLSYLLEEKITREMKQIWLKD